jgi:hypothetical protein
MRGLCATVALAACLVAAGCGAKTAGEAAIDAPGILVFSGLPSPPFLHSIRPDGSDLRGVALPDTCSPESFTRDGHTLICWDLDADFDGPFEYAVEREGAHWRRVSMPDQWAYPDWASPTEEDVDAPEWLAGGKKVAFIRPTNEPAWFSSTGDVAVTNADGSNERVVARDGQIPRWSPDGTRLAFARCEVFERNEQDAFARGRAECSLWTVAVTGTASPELLVEDADSPPVWSPDGRFVAFLRHSGACESYCRSQILVVSAKSGDPQKVGPELIQLNDCPLDLCPEMVWLSETAPVIVPTHDDTGDDELELQRCVDVWNRARMHPWPTGAVNVSLVDDRCQVTVSDYQAICTQTAEMQFRFWCPSHGEGFHNLQPDFRVWNAYGDKDGQISLFDPPKGPRLPLPTAPPHPMLDGYVIPYSKDGLPLPDLKLTEVTGTCAGGTGMPGYPLVYTDRYPVRCSWHPSEFTDSCFSPRRTVEAGDTVFCPDAQWKQPFDHMSFFAVKVTDVY